MTKKEALIATLDVQVSDNSVNLALINSEIDGDAAYTKSDQEAIEKCAVPLLFSLYTRPDISEGGFSISHPDFLRKVKERLLFFATKYGMTDILNQVDPKPTITSRPVW